MKNSSLAQRARMFRYGFFLLLIGAVVMVPLVLPRLFAHLMEVPFDLEKGRVIADLVIHGKLKETLPGQIDLPASLVYSHRIKTIYITKTKGDLMIVYFPTLENYSSRGYVFCSRTLVESDFSQREGNKSDVPEIKIRTRYSGSSDLLAFYPLNKKLNDHWYYSYTSLPSV